MRIISYGGGVQSTALCVLATQGKIGQIDAALFANVGDDSEHPSTITYVREVMIPWCAERGLSVHELKFTRKGGEIETLMQRMNREMKASGTSGIPMRLMPSGAPAKRNCTYDFKVEVISKWLKAHGVTVNDPAEVCIGFSTDEAHRISNKRSAKFEEAVYPLLDLRLSRTDCKRIISLAGLPVPPKSACFFCPYRRMYDWSKMRRDAPDLFAVCVDLEKRLNEHRKDHGKTLMYLTDKGAQKNLPIDAVVPIMQDDLLGLEDPDADSCDEGYCWT
jgi:hypothetical protein